MQKDQTQKTKTPQYTMWQNAAFMVGLAWRSKEKKVIALSCMVALLGFSSQVVALYITPMLLSAIERHVSITEFLMLILTFVGISMLVSAALAYGKENTLFGRITVRSELVTMLNQKAATTSYPNLDDEAFQKLYNKAREAVSSNEQASEAIWTTLTDLLKNVLGFVWYAYLLVSVNPLMLMMILVTSVIGYSVNNRLSGYGYRHREEETAHIEKMVYVNDLARDESAAKDIRIFGLRPWLEELAEKSMAAYVAFHRKAEGVYLWSRILDLVLACLRNAIAYLYLISLMMAGEIGISEFLLYFTAVEGFTAWVSGVLGTMNTLHQQSLDLSTVRECLEYPEPFLFEEGEDLHYEKGMAVEICLDSVCFRYPGADHDTLSGINLTLHPGEKLAVVGLNGAGKTTLVKILCGFLDPTEGRVLWNGKDIRSYDRRQYYKLFSAVFQDFLLLASTVAVNVTQDEDDIDRKRVESCIEKAGLSEKITSLPQGYDTLLNRKVYDEAAVLSGGETQRLMLARALYKDAPVVVLDEPTAALDPIAESDIYQKYHAMTANKSSVYISHRLASTRFCDRIILLDHGTIIEEGTHESLMQRCGKYAELYAVQSKYYQEEGGKNHERS